MRTHVRFHLSVLEDENPSVAAFLRHASVLIMYLEISAGSCGSSLLLCLLIRIPPSCHSPSSMRAYCCLGTFQSTWLEWAFRGSSSDGVPESDSLSPSFVNPYRYWGTPTHPHTQSDGRGDFYLPSLAESLNSLDWPSLDPRDQGLKLCRPKCRVEANSLAAASTLFVRPSLVR